MARGTQSIRPYGGRTAPFRPDLMFSGPGFSCSGSPKQALKLPAAQNRPKTGLSEGVGPIQIDPECFFAPGGWPESLRITSGNSFHDFFGSGLFLELRAGVGERRLGSEMGPWAPKLEVSARAFLAGALFSAQKWTPGPKLVC